MSNSSSSREGAATAADAKHHQGDDMDSWWWWQWVLGKVRQQAVDTANSGARGFVFCVSWWGAVELRQRVGFSVVVDILQCLVAAAGRAGDCSLSCKHGAMREGESRGRGIKVLVGWQLQLERTFLNCTD